MTIGEAILHFQTYPPETACSFDLWLPDDVRTIAAEFLPTDGEDGAITDEEVDETLATVYRRRDAARGTSWDTLVACMPETVQDRM